MLDLTQFEAGPSCTEALAWLGAEVVKVENPKGGDPGRSILRRATAATPYFLIFNANKRSITVDLKSPRGQEARARLARKADVFIENFAPGAIERLGLGYDVISQDQSRHHLRPGEGLRRRQPVREESRLRHDRAGVRRHDEHHRRARRPAGQARADARRYRHRHAAGHQHPGRAVREEETGKGERLQVAMQDAMLHYIRIAFADAGPDAAGRSSAPATQIDLGRQSAVRHLSRARAAGPTTTSTSTPAAPIPSTGSGC